MKSFYLILALLLPLWLGAQVTLEINQKDNHGMVIGYWEDFQFKQDTILTTTAMHKIGSSTCIFFRVESLDPASSTPFLLGFSGDTITIDLREKTIFLGGDNHQYYQFVQDVDQVLATQFSGKTTNKMLQYVLDRSQHFFDSNEGERKTTMKALYELSAVTNMKLYPLLVKHSADPAKIDSLAMLIQGRLMPDSTNEPWVEYLDRVTPVYATIADANIPELAMMNNLIRILRMHAVVRDSTLGLSDEYEIENNIIKELFPESRYRTRLVAYNLYSRIDNYTKYPTQLANASQFIEALKEEQFSAPLVPPIQVLYSKQLATFGTLAKGAKAPAFKLPDQTGQLVSLNDFRDKVVYIDVWASWCGPCLTEMPYLKELTKKFDPDKVAFVSISIDTKPDQWHSRIAQLELEGIQLIDSLGSLNSKTARDYKIHGVPHYILIDKIGRIASAFAPRPSLSSAVEEEIRSLLE